jgi:hypothetical protein
MTRARDVVDCRAVGCRASMQHVVLARGIHSTPGVSKHAGTVGKGRGFLMKKTVLAITAAAFLSGSLATPASAFVFVMLPAVLMAKEDKNFKPVNPYEKKTKVKKAKASKMKKA